MLQFSSNIVSEISSGNARALFCVHIKKTDGTLIYASTSYYNDVTLSNGVTYIADDTLISVQPPQFSTTVDRDQFKISIAGENFMNTIGDSGDLVGCKLEVYLCFINSATGTPYTNMPDTLPFYIGRLDGISAELETDEIGSEIFTINAASPMMALEMHKGVFLSREAIRARSPNDSCADAVYEGSGSLMYRWGR
jgi:hypothetical protein